MDILAAVIGAVVGGILGGVAGWWFSRRQESSRRAWEIAFAVSEVQADILSASTPRSICPKDVERLQSLWHGAHRRFFLLGQKKAAQLVTEHINGYLEHLKTFANGGMSREELENHRIKARDKVAEVMSKFAEG